MNRITKLIAGTSLILAAGAMPAAAANVDVQLLNKGADGTAMVFEPNLVKIDVEGAESMVFEGMSRVLAQSPGLNIIMEWSRSHFERTVIDAGSFYRRIRDEGFRSFLIDDERPGELVALSASPDRMEASNLLFSRCPENSKQIAP